jgi:hypothetical protein
MTATVFRVALVVSALAALWMLIGAPIHSY